MTVPADQSDRAETNGVRIVELSREPVELYKILKFEGMLTSGGEAKAAVAAGQVRVNGEIETQKRKKILSGDTIAFNGEVITVRFTPSPTVEASIPPDVTEAAIIGPVVEPMSDVTVAVDAEKK